MLNNTKQIEVNGKKYTLTVRRSILFKIAEICPELLRIVKKSNSGEVNLKEKENVLDILDDTSALDMTAKIYDNMPTLFYELIKVAHKDITREKSDEIYWDFTNEYNDVDENLSKFIQSVFLGGVPREKKKNLNW